VDSGIHRATTGAFRTHTRLAVLVSIEADRPEAWFPGPLGPYAAWLSGIDLSGDFERVKESGNPIKVRFVLVSFGILEITI
jgi:hypothetical protein